MKFFNQSDMKSYQQHHIVQYLDLNPLAYVLLSGRFLVLVNIENIDLL